MATTPQQKLEPVSLDRVTIDGPFWAPRQAVNRTVTLAAEYQQLEATGRLGALKLDWRPGQSNPPHIFWESDAAKWIEAAAYTLTTHPDPQLEAQVDQVIDMLAAAQQEDGYLNVHFTVVEPEKRWTNVRDWHELYCAGHLMEAAVAYYGATGKRKLLDVLSRYADYIDQVFGPGQGQVRGYPGHEEIELALVKLYRATGEPRYLQLARYFIDERGRQPHYFDLEARGRGEDPGLGRRGRIYDRSHDYCQAHLPVREQTTAEGHAVRAMYLFSGMADVGGETGDETLLAACRRLWANVTQRRMYVTGGVGSCVVGERFTYDYDLPNDIAYAETCAAIGLVFWAHRMLQLEGDSAYADVMERALYNGVLSGVSLDGARFFYTNPLEADPVRYAFYSRFVRASTLPPERQPWFDCACCPPNIARLLASLGAYAYSQGEGEAYVHLYTGGAARLDLAGRPVTLRQDTRYPWDGTVKIAVDPATEMRFTLALRIPGWCRGAGLAVNGQQMAIEPLTEKGYARIDRTWSPGDRVTLRMPMPVERVEAHPSVWADCGRAALQRGPLVFCLEQADNGPQLHDIALPREAELTARFDEHLLGGVVVIEGQAVRRDPAAWQGALYGPAGTLEATVPIKAIPYYAWANRDAGEMLVWIRDA